MAVRRNRCPECGGFDLSLVKEHNPETHDLNMDVTAKCNNPLCEHVFETRTTSHHTHKLRRQGRLI